MPQYRKLHTKIIDSYDFAEMPDDFCRVFWMLLIVSVDSEGRAMDNPAWLRSRMFPLRDDVSADHIERTLSWLANRKMIVRYQHNDRGYFYVPKFKTYQSGTEREAKSVLPGPDLLMSCSGPNQDKITTSSTASVFVVVNESVSDSVNEPDRPNIFTVYEREIGLLTPTISDELIQAEKDYPVEWIPDALKEAAKANKRNWRYALGILKNWAAGGRDSPHKNGKAPQPPEKLTQVDW